MCNGTEDEEIIFDDFEELKAVVPEGNFFKYFDGLKKEYFFSIIFEKYIFYFILRYYLPSGQGPARYCEMETNTEFAHCACLAT